MIPANPKPFSELLQEVDGEYVPYLALLATLEWRDKRSEIIKRDDYRCTSCSHSATENHWDSKNQRLIHFWWGDDELTFVKNEEGKQVLTALPKITSASKPYHLQVHHRFYIRNKLPWDYSSEILTTLCNWCHQELHLNEVVKVYDEGNNLLTDLTPCSRCNGAGWFPEYDHVNAGLCYRCGGAKFEELIKVKVDR
ncbi:MAG: hypothetical protein K0S09_1909 [Sphingobacteriaceae bacterium]|nr:hypothetical protein [Sphingobacteriaceae bacterium]